MIEQKQLEGTLPIYQNEEVIGSIDWKITPSESLVYLKFFSEMAKESYAEAMEALFGENGFVAQAVLNPELAPAMIINITEWTNLKAMTGVDHGSLSKLPHIPETVIVVDEYTKNFLRNFAVESYIGFVGTMASVLSNIILTSEKSEKAAYEEIKKQRNPEEELTTN